MKSTWLKPAVSMLLGAILVAGGSLTAEADVWPGTQASIGGAIAARIIAVKCSGPLTPAEISELDNYIDRRQTEFMMASEANRRVGETVFPQLARDYNESYSTPDACNASARDLAKDMLNRVRNAGKQASN